MASAKHLSDKQKAYRKRLLACIHQAPKYRDYFAANKDAYRDVLNDAFGKRSAAHLSINQLKCLLSFLNNNHGALPNHSHATNYSSASVSAIHTTNPQPNPSKLIEPITAAQIQFINSQWQQKATTPTPEALRKLVKKLFKIDIIGLHSLTKTQANGLINAINRIGA